MKKFLLTALACAGLCACNKEMTLNNNQVQKTFEGDVAYMTVRISDVGSLTRATDGGYANGSSAEYAVDDAYFYFYDDAGIYVSQAEVWDSGYAITGNTNIEFGSNTVIILKGLTNKNYPNYVVTVLNRPSDFTPGETLNDMAGVLSETAALGISNTSGNFVMSTSSYVDGTTDTRAAYFVTPVTEKDFYKEPIDMDEVVPVDIYVERLAAKVEVNFSSTLSAVELGDGEYGYMITETIAGDDNNDQTTLGTTDIYIKIIGWNLNGTTKHSLIVKDINGLDATGGVGGWTTWNAASDFRSFWGKSYNYGLGTSDDFPTSSNGATNVTGSDLDGTMLNDYLDYVSFNDLTLSVESSQNAVNYTYCAENTNTADILGNKYSTGITNVIIGAQICDINGDALELIRYNGELFEKDAYLNYVTNYLTNVSGLNVYEMHYDGSDAVYTRIDGSYITVDGSGLADGNVAVVVREDAFTGKEFAIMSDNVPSSLISTEDAMNAVSAALSESPFNTTSLANIYAGGMMYYHIPIEHLNNNTGDEGVVLEANYGIVRNHWYQLTINSLENLGKGVFDPDEVIIPTEDDDIFYYVGADIKILSWKLVSQDVDL